MCGGDGGVLYDCCMNELQPHLVQHMLGSMAEHGFTTAAAPCGQPMGAMGLHAAGHETHVHQTARHINEQPQLLVLQLALLLLACIHQCFIELVMLLLASLLLFLLLFFCCCWCYTAGCCTSQAKRLQQPAAAQAAVAALTM